MNDGQKSDVPASAPYMVSANPQQWIHAPLIPCRYPRDSEGSKEKGASSMFWLKQCAHCGGDLTDTWAPEGEYVACRSPWAGAPGGLRAILLLAPRCRLWPSCGRRIVSLRLSLNGLRLHPRRLRRWEDWREQRLGLGCHSGGLRPSLGGVWHRQERPSYTTLASMCQPGD